jgi:hypothetical protein
MDKEVAVGWPHWLRASLPTSPRDAIEVLPRPLPHLPWGEGFTGRVQWPGQEAWPQECLQMQLP